MNDLSPAPGDEPDLGPARPVEAGLRVRAERAYGADLGDVTVHTDAAAAAFAGRQGGIAATVGTRIAFAPGQYRPGTLRGDAVLAHELAHVVQQRESGPAEGDLTPGPAAEEHAADRAAAGMLLRSHGHDAVAESLSAQRPAPLGGPARVQSCSCGADPARMSDVRVDLAVTAEQQELMDSLEGLETPYEGIQDWEKASRALDTAQGLSSASSGMAAGQGFSVPTSGLELAGPMLVKGLYDRADAAAAAEGTTADDIIRRRYAFTQFFQDHAVNVAYSMLQTNELLIQGERDRYAGDANAGGTAELAAALAPHQATLKQAQADRAYAAGTTKSYGGGRGVVVTEKPADAAQKEAAATAAEDSVRKALVARFPVLADPDVKAWHLTEPGDVLQSNLLRILDGRLGDVRKTRGALLEKPSRVWDFDNAIKAARADLDIVDGSIFDLMIKDAIAKKEREELFTNLLVGALAIGLGLLSFGGGTVAVLGAIGGAAVSTGSAYLHIQKYVRESAAAGSALDRAKALSSTEPSLFWLAVDIAAAVLDIGLAAKAFAALGKTAKAVEAGTRTVAELKAEALAFAKSEPELAKQAENVAGAVEQAAVKRLSRKEVLEAAEKTEPAAAKAVRALAGTDEATSGLLRVEAAARAKLLAAFGKKPAVLARLGTLIDATPDVAKVIKLMSDGLSDAQFAAVIGKYMLTRSKTAPNILRAMAQVGLDADDVKIISAALGKSTSTKEIGKKFATAAIERIAEKLPAGKAGIEKYRTVAAGLHPNQSGIIFEKWATKNIYKVPRSERYLATKATLEKQFAAEKPAFKGTKAEIESDHVLHSGDGKATLVDYKSSQTAHAFSEEELAQLNNYAELLRIKAKAPNGDIFTRVEYLFGNRAAAAKNGPDVLAKLGDKVDVFFIDELGNKVRFTGAAP
jgi:Domain of unknown function (DUF4157)